MIILGLTGSIGMGKTTTAQMFRDEGADVFDADAAVHALYAAGGAAGPPLRPLFPEAVGADGRVDRGTLGRMLETDPSRVGDLEAVVHPLVRAARDGFLQAARTAGASVAVLDIPLLFETGADARVDAVVVVTAPAEVQRARVLLRPGMDEVRFGFLSSRQLPDADKRRRADFLVDTGSGFDAARRQVQAVMATVLQPGWQAP
jgi:dephospho-CoA kinase